MIGDFFSWYFDALIGFWGTALRLGLPQIVLLVLIFMWLKGKGCRKSRGKSCCRDWSWGMGKWGGSCCSWGADDDGGMCCWRSRGDCGRTCGQCCCKTRAACDASDGAAAGTSDADADAEATETTADADA